MVLCDPVQRAQSAFYHFYQAQWGPSFRAFVQRWRARGVVGADELWDGGLYGPLLERWLLAIILVVAL